jgi:hypothetical protein
MEGGSDGGREGGRGRETGEMSKIVLGESRGVKLWVWQLLVYY